MKGEKKSHWLQGKKETRKELTQKIRKAKRLWSQGGIKQKRESNKELEDGKKEEKGVTGYKEKGKKERMNTGDRERKTSQVQKGNKTKA